MKKCIVTMTVMALAVMATSASAAFVGGVESFNGTVLDTSTWEYYETHSADAITQNNDIQLDAYGTAGKFPVFHYNDLTTKTQTVSIGEKVRVDVTRVTSNWLGSIMLTDDSGGVGARSGLDNNFVRVNQFTSGLATTIREGIAAYSRVGGIDSSTSYVTHKVNGSNWPTTNTKFIYEIEYTSSTSMTVAVYDSNGVLVDSGGTLYTYTANNPTTITFSASMPDSLYISLEQGGSTTVTNKFDTVTIVPEPATIGLLCFGGLAALIRRKR